MGPRQRDSIHRRTTQVLHADQSPIRASPYLSLDIRENALIGAGRCQALIRVFSEDRRDRAHRAEAHATNRERA